MTDAKRVLILTSDAGLGHRSAAEAIGAAIRDRHESRCDVRVVNPAAVEGAPEILRGSEKGYDQIVSEMPDLYQSAYEISDSRWASTVGEAVFTVAFFQTIRTLLRQHRPDIVVTTYPLYQAPVGAVDLIDNLGTTLITVVTDLVTVHSVWFSKSAHLCLVPTDAARDLALEHGLPPENVQVCGIPVHPAIANKERPTASIREALGWQTAPTTFLVVGGKRVDHLSAILRALNHANLPIQLAVVAGHDKAFYQHLQETDWHTAIHSYGFVSNMPTLMHAADAIICKAGGLIVTESLACGLPLLLVDVLPGQEEGNAQYVVAQGAGEIAQDPSRACETVYHWIEGSGERLADCAARAAAVGRPRAAYDVAAHVYSMLERDRRAAPSNADSDRPALVEQLNRHGIPWRDAD